MNVSIQGIKGAFHEEAALKHFGQDVAIVPELTFDQVVESIRTGKAQKGMMAVENTISGTLHSNLNLIRESGLRILGEPWQYRFYVDLLVNDRQQYRHMLSAVRPMVDQLVVLGEYIAGIDSFNKIHTQP